MKNKLDTFFALLKNISPDADFVSRSKAQILSREQDRALPGAGVSFVSWLQSHNTAKFAIGLASVVLLTTIGLSSYLGSNTRSLTRSFNNNTLTKEADSLDFQIHIKEAVYYDETAQEIAVALDKIAN